MNGELRTARARGVPIVSILTTDEPATIASIKKKLPETALVQYDIVRGFIPLNEAGAAIIQLIVGDLDPILFTDPTSAISAAMDKAEQGTCLICLSSQRFLKDEKTQQAIANCRDAFKATSRTLILLSSPDLVLPSDLSQDIYQIIDEPPTEEERALIIRDMHQSAEVIEPEPEQLKQAVIATRGLSFFAAEQATALSISKQGLDQKALFKRWEQGINATPGLTVERSGATMADIGGLDSIKTFATRLMSGKESPSAIIRIEEIEKALSGAGTNGAGDSSGTSQSMLGSILTYMQEENQTGLIAVGPAGSGKSLCSTAIGSAGNIPTITLDLGALKGSLVGQTEGNTRKALSTIKALAGQGALWIATCNSMAALPPELRRRFQYGIWFFDLPTFEERMIIWSIWMKKMGMTWNPGNPDSFPNDKDWTGAEIRTCCQIAYRLNLSLVEAAEYIVPVAKMASDQIEALRRQATGKYLSASYKGTYQPPKKTVETVRKIEG